jgi:hypothetical protein
LSALGTFLAAGITERQINYWVTKGYLRPSGGGGAGYPWEWPRTEVAIALSMKRLTEVGFTPATAADIARNAETVRHIGRLSAADPVPVDLGNGLELTINPIGKEAAA